MFCIVSFQRFLHAVHQTQPYLLNSVGLFKTSVFSTGSLSSMLLICIINGQVYIIPFLKTFFYFQRLWAYAVIKQDQWCWVFADSSESIEEVGRTGSNKSSMQDALWGTDAKSCTYIHLIKFMVVNMLLLHWPL